MKTQGVVFAVLLLGAFALRAWNLSAQSLDVDEFSELQITHKTYGEAAFAADSMPPLYPWLLKTWLKVYPGEHAGRWFSAFIGVATVGAVSLLWSRAFGYALATTTAVLLAFSPLHIYYSQYIRSYGLLMFWTALAIGTLAVAVRSERMRDWAWFAVSALGGLYTHYYFAVFLAVLSLTLACWAYGWRWSRQWWATNVCIGVLALPLIAFVGEDLHFQKSLRESRPLDVSSLGYTYVSMLTGYSIGPSKRELQMLDRKQALAAALPIATAVGAIFLGLGFMGAVYLHKRRLLSVFLVLAVVPVLLVGLLGLVANVTFNPRFVVWSLFPLLAVLAAGAVQAPRSWVIRSSLLLLMLVSCMAIYNRHCVAEHQNEDVRSLGDFLQQKPTQRAPVFVISNYMAPLIPYYLPGEWEVLELPKVDDVAELSDSQGLVSLAEKALAENLQSGVSYWLVYTREFHGDPDGDILTRLRRRDDIEKVQEFAGIVLYRGLVQSEP